MLSPLKLKQNKIEREKKCNKKNLREDHYLTFEYSISSKFKTETSIKKCERIFNIF